MDVAMVGLGRMGANMARRLLRGGHRVVVWNRTYAKARSSRPRAPRRCASWPTCPARCRRRASSGSCCPQGAAHAGRDRRARRRCSPRATSSSTAATRPSSDDIERGAALAAQGLRYLDVGTSGGVWGLEVGYCLMVGGERSAFEHDRAAPRHAGAARPRLRLHGRPRRGSLREDGPQRHRVRPDAGLRRGLRAARGAPTGTSTSPPSPTSGTRAAWCARWLLELAADAFRKDPGLDADHGLRGGHRARAAGRWSRRSSTPCPCP